MKRFALIGAGGYIAPWHLKAIKDTGSQLTAALDIHDNVGVLDGCFPDADFFTEFERFDRYVEKLRRTGEKMDYISICSPNYLHDAQIRFALKCGIDAICEKPLVLNPWNLEALEEMEKETGRVVHPILQLRLHPTILQLREKLRGKQDRIHDVELTYIVPHGRWYFISWRGREDKAGGLSTHIGIHFLDILIWLFGDIKKNLVHLSEPQREAGYLELERARVKWFFSVDREYIPDPYRANWQSSAYCSFCVDNEEMDLTSDLSDLHTASYEEILQGRGFGLRDARKSIEAAYFIRNASAVGLHGDYHPLASIEVQSKASREFSEDAFINRLAPGICNFPRYTDQWTRVQDVNDELSLTNPKHRRSSSDHKGPVA